MNRYTIGRTRPAGLMLCAVFVGALLVAGCGSSSTPTPTAGGAASPAAGASAVAPTAVPPTQAAAQNADAVFALATTRLADLSSYRFAVALEGQGVTATEGSSGGSVNMRGTVILKPARALRFEMSATSTDAAESPTQLTYVLIGDKAWVGADGMLTEIPADGAAGMSSTFDAFLPEKLFGTNFVDYGSGYRSVGEEQKNGVACLHYQADSSVLDQYAALHGVTGDWHADVWIAKDGGFPVSWAVSGSAATGDASGTYSMSADITNINDSANEVSAPS